eukprot:TRINITY_DN2950_c0_g1_i1.p2 TRINITY_DN2950_c0_g1~~TRINITY_DN2950_c0_g1_i1.p2  ORF type:complete len:233 (-),score=42.67 TRINITY_DN2950_c0_g1_i1:1013-1711(-)
MSYRAKPLVENATVHGHPLDYSFMNILDVAEIVNEDPVRGKRKGASSPGKSPTKASGSPEKTPAKAPTDGPVVIQTANVSPSADASAKPKKIVKTITTGLRLSNNRISTVAKLPEAINEVIDHPSELALLDLSFNVIEHIEDVIFQFPKLSVLYLHMNKIADISEVSKLAALPLLRALTLNGNPIEEKHKDSYRATVVAMLPNLRTLDFGPITTQERQRAATVGKRLAARSK